jgi:hypothetical protein
MIADIKGLSGSVDPPISRSTEGRPVAPRWRSVMKPDLFLRLPWASFKFPTVS